MLFHVTEPVGHRYAGKGGLSVRSFYDYAVAHPATTLIGAHWGGGLPFYSVMPEVRALDNVLVDTAATSLLYAETIYESVARLAGAQRVLFGSDYPLLSQSRSRRRIEEAGLEAGACDLLLGGNAARLLGLG